MNLDKNTLYVVIVWAAVVALVAGTMYMSYLMFAPYFAPTPAETTAVNVTGPNAAGECTVTVNGSQEVEQLFIRVNDTAKYSPNGSASVTVSPGSRVVVEARWHGGPYNVSSDPKSGVVADETVVLGETCRFWDGGDDV